MSDEVLECHLKINNDAVCSGKVMKRYVSPTKQANSCESCYLTYRQMLDLYTMGYDMELLRQSTQAERILWLHKGAQK